MFASEGDTRILALTGFRTTMSGRQTLEEGTVGRDLRMNRGFLKRGNVVEIASGGSER